MRARFASEKLLPDTGGSSIPAHELDVSTPTECGRCSSNTGRFGTTSAYSTAGGAASMRHSFRRAFATSEVSNLLLLPCIEALTPLTINRDATGTSTLSSLTQLLSLLTSLQTHLSTFSSSSPIPLFLMDKTDPKEEWPLGSVTSAGLVGVRRKGMVGDVLRFFFPKSWKIEQEDQG